MTLRGGVATVLLCAVAVVALFGGCGSSSDDSTSSSDDSTTAATGTTAPSKAFTGKGNNGPASFGRVASEQEREAASKVLEESLKARAAHDWATQCETIIGEKASQAEVYAPGKGCAAGLAAEVKRFSVKKSTLANTMTGPIAVLRVKGKFGYALYHGKKGKDYAMLMKKEGGEWKAAELTTDEVP